MAINKVEYGDATLIDLTEDNVTPETLLQGATAHNAAGEEIQGMVPPMVVDSEMSTESTNPVQNKVITDALNNHISDTIATESGVHGLRYYGSKLSYKDAEGEWNEIKTGGGANALLVVNVESGAVVTLSDGQSATSVNDKVQFDVTYGTYTITATKDDKEKTSSVTITELKIYEITLSFPGPLQEWLALGGVVNTYESIDEISEADMRRLMIKHASVDYLATWLNDDTSMQDTFIDCDYAMKWLGIQDYAYDKITASVSGFETKLLASDNWEYILKDKVPTMTSDTAPYGEASANGYNASKFKAYKAFDGDEDTFWAYLDSSENAWILYKFDNPICVKKIKIKIYYYMSILYCKQFKIQASNDNNSWVDLYTSEEFENKNYDSFVKNIKNDNYYIYYRFLCLGNYDTEHQNACGVNSLQFYGRSLNVSVPIMTSNTAPYGECSASAINAGSLRGVTNTNPYVIFAGATDVSSSRTYLELAQSSNDIYYQYKFDKPMVCKMSVLQGVNDSGDNGYYVKRCKLMASNDGSIWVNLGENSSYQTTNNAKCIVTTNNDTPYMYYRLVILECMFNNTNVNRPTCPNLNFYGVDYSETTDLVPFATGSDQQIARMIEDSYYEGLDLTQYWSVGDKRKIYLNAMEANGVSEAHHADYYDFVILGFNHDDLTTPINGKTKSAITIQTDRILYKNTTDTTYSSSYPATADEGGYMNSTNTNEGGWESCARRAWCNNIFIGSLPLYVQSNVKKVNKLTSAGSQSSEIKTTEDSVFLPSEIEIFGSATNSASGEGNHYSYFATTSNRYKKPTFNDNVSAYSWGRSPDLSSSTGFCNVHYSGTTQKRSAGNNMGIAPCICL